MVEMAATAPQRAPRAKRVEDRAAKAAAFSYSQSFRYSRLPRSFGQGLADLGAGQQRMGLKIRPMRRRAVATALPAVSRRSA